MLAGTLTLLAGKLLQGNNVRAGDAGNNVIW